MTEDSKASARPTPFGADWSAEPLPSVRFGRRLASARLPRWLETPRRAAKRVAWTWVESRRVDTPLRYAARELMTHRRAAYRAHDGTARFVLRHRSGDIEIFRKFYAYGYYNLPATVSERLEALGRAVNVLDLGANIGFFEVFTRDRLQIGRVVCVEPDPYNSDVLDQVRRLNGADWEIMRACAAASDGTTQFNTGRKNLSRIGSDGDITIATRDVFPLIAAADLVKMNIEGSEWEVLADERLASTDAIWIVEYHRIANPDQDIHGHVRRLFEAGGYVVQQAQKGEENGLLWAWRP